MSNFADNVDTGAIVRIDRAFLKRRFAALFGKSEPTLFFSPGRVNLIGEHIDYNGGRVFPCALSLGIYAAARVNGGDTVALYSENFPQTGTVHVKLSEIARTGSWADFPLGVFDLMQKRLGVALRGMDIFFAGDLPDGAGLSSSAAIGVLSCVVASALCGMQIDDVPGLCRDAESEFHGVNCGIMDQFAVYMGRRDTAICLDTHSMAYEYVPLRLDDAYIVICSSNKKRTLADSKYNQRRAECEAALSVLRQVRALDHLCALTPGEFETLQGVIGDETLRRRARHAVYENDRTFRAVAALRRGETALFGQLMNESHASLRDDFEVTGAELDTLVSLAQELDGVLGSRMTGAGFGGSTVSLVRGAALKGFAEHIKKGYYERFGYYPDVFAAKPENGAGPLEEVS